MRTIYGLVKHCF